ncbi:hypothetical protein [Hoeflea ulvae]|uniref:Uncharacterized protein n=1 Tax=Hoeflea ulvae TaxID=2983764 RepID=A0ABT3YJP3_9HYPH|nr:hypothetical protein [Hoeflea ulvae]MCY0096124.1 hypothetical protein [Hoeflea ulvae]
MIRLFCLTSAVMALAGPASALQKFEEYRIMGNEIRSVEMGPQEVEDPATLIITLQSEGGESRQILLESDGFLDDCMQTINYTIGDTSRYIQIRAHLTADTMNGAVITECTSVSIQGY